MIKFKKTHGNHAFGKQYEYFYQLSRRRRWLTEDPNVTKVIQYLQAKYGPASTREGVPNPKTGTIYMHRMIPNDNWWIDHNRRRIYITKGATITMRGLVLL